MTQELNTPNTSQKLIDIDSIDAKALLGIEESGPSISSDQPFRKWLYDWTLNPNIPGNFQSTLERWIAILIVANLFALVFEHVPAIYEPNQHWFHYFDVISVVIFSIEYVTRLYLAPEDEEFKKYRFARARYATSPFALIDLVAILPFFLQAFIAIDLRFLRFLRLLRILKLSKYNTALQDLFSAVYSEKRAFGSAAFLLLIATIVSASLMHFAEGHAQPEHFGTIPHSIYWAIVSITSGYGNIAPVTKFGELVALLTGFLGVCMAAILTGIVASAFSNQMSRKKSAYQAQLRQVLADGAVSDAERDTLKRLQAQFRLSDKEVQTMLDQAQGKLKQ